MFLAWALRGALGSCDKSNASPPPCQVVDTSATGWKSGTWSFFCKLTLCVQPLFHGISPAACPLRRVLGRELAPANARVRQKVIERLCLVCLLLFLFLLFATNCRAERQLFRVSESLSHLSPLPSVAPCRQPATLQSTSLTVLARCAPPHGHVRSSREDQLKFM